MAVGSRDDPPLGEVVHGFTASSAQRGLACGGCVEFGGVPCCSRPVFMAQGVLRGPRFSQVSSVHGDTTPPNGRGGLPRLCLNRPPGLGGASCFMGGVSGTIQAVGGAARGSASPAGLFRLQRRAGAPPNNAMQLTKLRAAPVLQAEVPPCAPAGRMDGGTASQLIARVRRTRAGECGKYAEATRLEMTLPDVGYRSEDERARSGRLIVAMAPPSRRGTAGACCPDAGRASTRPGLWTASLSSEADGAEPADLLPTVDTPWGDRGVLVTRWQGWRTAVRSCSAGW